MLHERERGRSVCPDQRSHFHEQRRRYVRVVAGSQIVALVVLQLALDLVRRLAHVLLVFDSGSRVP